MNLIIYLIPGITWFILKQIYSPLQSSRKEYVFVVFLFIFLYPLFFVLNYRSFLKLRTYLKPFNKWRFIFFREIKLLEGDVKNLSVR